MSTYKELTALHGSDTMINYGSFKDSLKEYNKNTDVNIEFTKSGLKIFLEKFYIPLMKRLTSFPNIFKLVEFLESCYGPNSPPDIELKNEIEKLYKEKPNISSYEVYNELFIPFVQNIVDDGILMTINRYGEDDTDLEPIDDIIYLKIDSKNVEAIIDKIRKTNEKMFNL